MSDHPAHCLWAKCPECDLDLDKLDPFHAHLVDCKHGLACGICEHEIQSDMIGFVVNLKEMPDDIVGKAARKMGISAISDLIFDLFPYSKVVQQTDTFIEVKIPKQSLFQEIKFN